MLSMIARLHDCTNSVFASFYFRFAISPSLQNPLLKAPSPMMMRHHQQDILPLPARSPYNALPRHQQPPQPPYPQQQQYHFQSSPLHTMTLVAPQQPPGTNGRIPPNQVHHNHQSQQAPPQQRQSRHRQRSCMDLWLSKYKERSKRIDVVSRLVFPVGFFIFNCVYWTVYML